MGANTRIEWAHHTFNPWWGCQRVGPGCDNCYAEAWARRWGDADLWYDKRRRTSASNWKEPLKWDRAAAAAGTRARVFCASMADVFDNQVPEDWRRDLFELISRTPNLDWLLLTKRIGNARRMMDDIALRAWPERERGEWKPADNIWLGATVVNQEEADRDIPKLLATPARIRFLSIEPMLGPIDLSSWLAIAPDRGGMSWRYKDKFRQSPLIDWVICGGESGHHARPIHPDWVRSIRDQCSAAGVPFLFKQWGEWKHCRLPGEHAPSEHIFPDGAAMARLGKKHAGRELDGITHDGFPS